MVNYIKVTITAVLLAVTLTACTGAISGHQYSLNDLEKVYLVIEKGAGQFLTEEQIKEYKLDEANAIIKYAYSLDSEGKVVE